MADITDPRAVKFSDEVLRPLCEKMRGMKAEIDAALVEWNSQISPLVTGEDNLIDNRDPEGVSRLNGTDITNAVAQFIAYQTQLNTGGVADVIQKPCVRVLSGL
jgi:hypothetical protein